jgi:hypothetical protein
MTIVMAPDFREGVKDAVVNIEAVGGNWWKWTGVRIPKHCFIKWVKSNHGFLSHTMFTVPMLAELLRRPRERWRSGR